MFELWISQYLTLPVYAALVVAAYMDIRYRRIPNRLTLCIIIYSMGCHCVWSGPMGVLQSLAALCIATAIFLFPFALHWMGAGDAKLAGAVGAFCGLGALKSFIFWMLVSATVLSIVFYVQLLVRDTAQRARVADGLRVFAVARSPRMLASSFATRGTTMPFAVAIVAGTFATGMDIHVW